MTSIYKAKYNPYIYVCNVPNNTPTEMILSLILKKRLDISGHVCFHITKDLQMFDYEDYVKNCVNFDAAYTVIKHTDPDLYYSIVNSHRVRREITTTLMSEVMNQPICLQGIQLNTIGIIPITNARMRIFQD